MATEDAHSVPYGAETSLLASFYLLQVAIQSDHLLNMLSFLQSILWVSYLKKKAGGYRSVDLYVGTQFYSTDQGV